MTATRQSILMILLTACAVPSVLRAEASPRPDTCKVIRITPQTAWIEAHPAPERFAQAVAGSWLTGMFFPISFWISFSNDFSSSAQNE